MSEAETGQATSTEAPEVQTAVTPENVTTPQSETEAVEGEQTQAEDKKSFSQSELDSIIQKEKAKAEARAERRALKVYAEKLEAMNRQPAQVQLAQQDGKPVMAQFPNVEDYVEAVADWKMGQRDRESQQQQVQKQAHDIRTKASTVIEDAEKIPGFDRDAFESLPLSDASTLAILDSDVAAKLIAHLTSNPQEAQRIYALTPARQAAEIGKMEVKLASAPKVSKAPEPITPIGGRSGNATKTIFDPDLSQSEFDKMRRAHLARR